MIQNHGQNFLWAVLEPPGLDEVDAAPSAGAG